MTDDAPAVGTWWAISERQMLEMLHEVADGADPELVYAEHYANTEPVPPA